MIKKKGLIEGNKLIYLLITILGLIVLAFVLIYVIFPALGLKVMG